MPNWRQNTPSDISSTATHVSFQMSGAQWLQSETSAQMGLCECRVDRVFSAAEVPAFPTLIRLAANAAE